MKNYSCIKAQTDPLCSDKKTLLLATQTEISKKKKKNNTILETAVTHES